jgi:uncharacterized protein
MSRRRLELLESEISARCAETAAARGHWPCRAGCDDCCRSLAAVPELTSTEWERLRDALDGLDGEARSEVMRSIADRRARGAERPIQCPLLDPRAGTCRVYDARPVACRTYGFYAERDGVLGCSRIESISTERDAVIWGNHQVVLRARDELGEVRSLLEWMNDEC